MNVWKTTLVMGGVLFLLGGGVSWTLADPGEGNHPHDGMPHMGMGHGEEHGGMEGHHGGMSPLSMKEELELTAEQEAQMRPLELEYRKAMIQNGANLRVAMMDLGTLLDAKVADKAALDGKVNEIGALQKKMMQYRVDVLLQVKGILNPDQYAKFRTKLRDRMEGMSHHPGGMKEGMEGHSPYSGKHHGEEHGYGKGMPQDHP